MRHFSCDLCGKDLTPGADARYVVRMEVAAATDPRDLTEADLDQDHLDAMAEMLDELEDAGPEALAPTPATRALEYDLCAGCHRKFIADPLGRDRARKPQFSKN
jgi:hypothetical protein